MRAVKCGKVRKCGLVHPLSARTQKGLAMQCNIDSKGRTVRLAAGAVADAAGAVVLVLTFLHVLPWWGWVLGGALSAAATFMIFEAVLGWCALRAMGVKTPV